MENINILIYKSTRQVDLSKSVIGNDGENLQENLVFTFDEFVDGTARLEIIKPDKIKSYLMLTKVDETYQIPVKSVITKTGRISMQLVITEGTDDEEIPIFKSNTFYVVCNTSINAETIQEEDYPTFIDRAETKLNAMDIALGEVDNLDITASKSGTTATITITDKEGNETSVEIYDGTNGIDGQDGITPTIGDNGDWYLGDTDTGKPSRGETGPVGPAGAIKMLIVNVLPETGEEGTLYFVPKQDTETSDIYDEYMWVNNAFELLGEKQITVDLSDYYTKEQTNALIPTSLSELTDDTTHRLVSDTEKSTWNGKVSPTDYASSNTGGVIKISSTYGTTQDSGILYALTKTYEQYNSGANGMFIGKGTLENVITGKGLVSNTNYASSSAGGVVKVQSLYATNIDGNGNLYAVTKTYSEYSNGSNAIFISKGTLNNVLTAVVGDIDTILDSINNEVL